MVSCELPMMYSFDLTAGGHPCPRPIGALKMLGGEMYWTSPVLPARANVSDSHSRSHDRVGIVTRITSLEPALWPDSVG